METDRWKRNGRRRSIEMEYRKSRESRRRVCRGKEENTEDWDKMEEKERGGI